MRANLKHCYFYSGSMVKGDVSPNSSSGLDLHYAAFKIRNFNLQIKIYRTNTSSLLKGFDKEKLLLVMVENIRFLKTITIQMFHLIILFI